MARSRVNFSFFPFYPWVHVYTGSTVTVGGQFPDFYKVSVMFRKRLAGVQLSRTTPLSLRSVLVYLKFIQNCS
jgi:hypothetical protein